MTARFGHLSPEGTAITAEISRGKAAGLYVERKEVNARMTAVVEVEDD